MHLDGYGRGMATRPRKLYPGAAYHITVRSVDGRALFLDDVFRIAFLAQLGRVVADDRLICDAYCLMTNHYHVQLRTPHEGLPAAMQRLNTWLAVTFNRRLGRRGRVLEAPYGAKPIETEAHLAGVARYIPLNPVRAGIVEHPHDYRWSSYRATAGTAPRPRFLTTSWLLSQIGGRERYAAFVEAGRDVTSLDEILLADES